MFHTSLQRCLDDKFLARLPNVEGVDHLEVSGAFLLALALKNMY
jgi:hypothetical protein